MGYLNPAHSGIPRHQPVDLFHPPQHPIDNLTPTPAAYQGGPFNELVHNALSGYNPIRTYNNLN